MNIISRNHGLRARFPLWTRVYLSWLMAAILRTARVLQFPLFPSHHRLLSLDQAWASHHSHRQVVCQWFSYHLAGQAVKTSATRSADLGDLGWIPAIRRGSFTASSQTCDLKIGNPMTNPSGSWNWWVKCPCTVTGSDRTFGLQLLSHGGSTYNSPSRFVSAIH